MPFIVQYLLADDVQLLLSILTSSVIEYSNFLTIIRRLRDMKQNISA